MSDVKPVLCSECGKPTNIKRHKDHLIHKHNDRIGIKCGKCR